MPKQNLLDTLVSRGLVALDELGAIKADAKKQGLSIEDTLYQRGVDEEAILEAKSEILGFPTKNLMGTKVPFDVLR